MNAQRRTFHRCRAPDPRGQVFTIDECSNSGQVMNIVSAVVGYSDPAYLIPVPPYTQPHCPSRNCTLSIFDAVFRSCNGLRSCSITQDLLLRPGPGNSALCALQTDANFINVRFHCASGTIISLHGIIYLRFTSIYSCHFHVNDPYILYCVSTLEWVIVIDNFYDGWLPECWWIEFFFDTRTVNALDYWFFLFFFCRFYVAQFRLIR